MKGGVGKSSTAIQIANCLGKTGKKVLIIDMDLNNSVSSYYLTDETKNSTEKNIANALSKASNNLNDYILLTDRYAVDLIPSSLYLVDLRGLSERRLSQLLPTIENAYDYVIIDTQPTYDNLVLNAYYASDYIITPLHLSLFDYNTSLFMADKLKMETDKFQNWFLHINGFNHRFEDAKKGQQKEYIDVFKNTFDNLTPAAAWFPWTSAMRQVIDRNMFLSITEKEGCICNPALFNSICNLADIFFNANEEMPLLEMF